MILYNGQSLTVKDKFRPESMSLTLEERKSQASLTIGPDAPEISVGDWMRDDTEPGSGILWRVKSVSDQVEKQTRTVALEHISATLRDCVIFGEWEPEGGCTAQAAVNYALAQTGGLWELGDWEVSNPTNPYKFASTTVFGAIETVSASVSGVFWEYDLSAIPFRLHMRLISDSAASEMRMSRNILSLKRSVDRSRMYTRIYPIGADDLHITGDYLSKNENIYGRVDHIETDQSKDSAAELQRWAQERLNTHCEPAVSIQISGLDYSRETGEALDALRIGTRCRVPLPEYGTTILETLTRLQWKDKIAKPEEVTVNLANIQEDVASIFRKVSGSAASNSRAGGRGSKKKKEEDHAWFVDTTDHVAMVAEAIIGRAEGETPEHLWSRVSTIVVDGEGIHQRVTANADGIAMHGTAIEQNEDAISLAVGTYQIDPEKIQRYPGGTSTFPQTGQTGYYYLDTSVTPNRMYIWKNGQYNLLSVSQDGAKGFLIKAGEIAIALNESGDAEAVIDAKKVVIGSGITRQDLPDWMDDTEGLITDKASVGSLNAVEARVGTLEADAITADNINTKLANANVANIGSLAAGDMLVNSFSLKGALQNVFVASQTGNTVTLELVPVEGSHRQISSSNATSLSGVWSGTTYTVTASPQGNTESDTVYQQIEGSANPNATAYAKMYHSDPSVAANQIGSSLAMTLDKSDSSKKVDLVVNSLVKATVSTASTWNAGYNQGSPISGTAGGRTSGVTALVHDFTITKADGTTAVIAIDCTSIYSTARTGYSPGTYTQATVTPQGEAYGDITPIGSSGGKYTSTLLYYPGTGFNYLEVSGEITGRGRAATVQYEGILYSKNSYGGYTSQGDGKWYRNSGSLYLGNGGDGYTGSYKWITPIGSPIWALVPDSSGGTEYYTKGTKIIGLRHPGTPDSTTYYTKS